MPGTADEMDKLYERLQKSLVPAAERILVLL